MIHVGGYHEYIGGGYHEYIGGCSVHRGMFSTSGDMYLFCPESSWIRNQWIGNTKRIFAIDKFSPVL